MDVLLDQVVLPSARRCVLVVEDGQLHGLLALHNTEQVPRARWATARVDVAMIPRDQLKAVRPDDDLGTALKRMADEDVNQFAVMDNGHLLGMVARDTVLAFLRTWTALGMQAGAGTGSTGR